MTLVYADTSALARAYFADEPEHVMMRARLLEGEEQVVTSELTRVELACVIRAAVLTGRLRDREGMLERIEANYGEQGRIRLLRLRSETVVPAAYRLVLDHRLRTLDALHLAVAIEECPVIAGDDDVVFVTRDRDQAAAAAAVGLVVE